MRRDEDSEGSMKNQSETIFGICMILCPIIYDTAMKLGTAQPRQRIESKFQRRNNNVPTNQTPGLAIEKKCSIYTRIFPIKDMISYSCILS